MKITNTRVILYTAFVVVVWEKLLKIGQNVFDTSSSSSSSLIVVDGIDGITRRTAATSASAMDDDGSLVQCYDGANKIPIPATASDEVFARKTIDRACKFEANTKATDDLVRAFAGQNRTLPTPIINVGMPKMGSTSLYSFFGCAGYESTHWKCVGKTLCGDCMQKAVANNKSLLATCAGENGKAQAFLQMDSSEPDIDACVWPQMSYLERIHEEHPHATFIFMTRPLDDWIRSVNRFKHLYDRLTTCNLPNWPSYVKFGRKEMKQWVCDHQQRVRAFVKKYPTHHLVELNLYNKKTGKILSQLFGSTHECFGHENKNVKKAQAPKAKKVSSRMKKWNK